VGVGVTLTANYLGTRGAILGTLGVLVGWVAAAWLLFWLAGAWVTVAGPVMAGFLAYASITAYRQLTEERQKRFIRSTFQNYLSPSLVDEVLKNPDALRLGGERRDLTVFFSDVADFTPISERMESEALFEFLNDYLSEMSEVILDAGGYINKYIGDGIMAVWGAPLAEEKHAQTACLVALESQRRLKDFREKLQTEKRPIIRARIGINSGVMHVGNMGSRKRLEYTVMGDNVNVASRLEGAGKHFGTEIIIGEDTWRRVQDQFEARRLGMVTVKGRTRPVGAYELLAEKGKCPPLVARLLPRYEAGLEAYAQQQWDEAVAAFGACLEINPKDGPSRAYLNRCHLLKERAAEEEWDGSFALDMK
jgi:adenylate cyclase